MVSVSVLKCDRQLLFLSLADYGSSKSAGASSTVGRLIVIGIGSWRSSRIEIIGIGSWRSSRIGIIGIGSWGSSRIGIIGIIWIIRIRTRRSSCRGADSISGDDIGFGSRRAWVGVDGSRITVILSYGSTITATQTA